jgi:hypothetical protein
VYEGVGVGLGLLFLDSLCALVIAQGRREEEGYHHCVCPQTALLSDQKFPFVSFNPFTTCVCACMFVCVCVFFLPQATPGLVSDFTPVAVPVLASYRQVGVPHERRLVWTMLPVLDHEPASIAHKFLELMSPPPIQLVQLTFFCYNMYISVWPM